MSTTVAAQKFDAARANEYQAQSRIALAGYDAYHQLSACMLSAAIGGDNPARLLIVGAGGGAQEIVTASVLGPKWHFTAVDPSKPMMDIAVAWLTETGLADRTDFHLGYVDDLPADRQFELRPCSGSFITSRGRRPSVRFSSRSRVASRRMRGSRRRAGSSRACFGGLPDPADRRQRSCPDTGDVIESSKPISPLQRTGMSPDQSVYAARGFGRR